MHGRMKSAPVEKGGRGGRPEPARPGRQSLTAAGPPQVDPPPKPGAAQKSPSSRASGRCATFSGFPSPLVFSDHTLKGLKHHGFMISRLPCVARVRAQPVRSWAGVSPRLQARCWPRLGSPLGSHVAVGRIQFPRSGVLWAPHVTWGCRLPTGTVALGSSAEWVLLCLIPAEEPSQRLP